MIEIEIRPAEYQVLIGGRRVPFTVREFQMFQCLARQRDRVVTRQEIYACVWGGGMAHRDRSVDVFVRKVRAKLAAACPGIEFVHTHFGIGYRYAPEPARQEAVGGRP
jgi:DNA-binding response OmpR family regulator